MRRRRPSSRVKSPLSPLRTLSIVNRNGSLARNFSLASDRSESDYDYGTFSVSGEDDAATIAEHASYADWSRLFRLNRPELVFIILGCLFSFIVGAVFPTFAVIFALNLDLLSNPEPEGGMSRVSLFVVVFVGIGVIDLLAHAAQVSRDDFVGVTYLLYCFCQC